MNYVKFSQGGGFRLAPERVFLMQSLEKLKHNAVIETQRSCPLFYDVVYGVFFASIPVWI